MSATTFRAIAWRNHAKTTVVTDEVATDGPSFVRVVAECSGTGARDGQAEAEEAMARRIAACLNSAEGSPTELMEEVPGLLGQTLPTRILRQQHAELRTALAFAIRFFDQLTPADAERMRKVLEKAGGAA